jgi:hypothetical protein
MSRLKRLIPTIHPLGLWQGRRVNAVRDRPPRRRGEVQMLLLALSTPHSGQPTLPCQVDVRAVQRDCPDASPVRGQAGVRDGCQA